MADDKGDYVLDELESWVAGGLVGEEIGESEWGGDSVDPLKLTARGVGACEGDSLSVEIGNVNGSSSCTGRDDEVVSIDIGQPSPVVRENPVSDGVGVGDGEDVARGGCATSNRGFDDRRAVGVESDVVLAELKHVGKGRRRLKGDQPRAKGPCLV